jgi:hypothetical protein
MSLHLYHYILTILVLLLPVKTLQAATSTPTPTPSSTRSVSFTWNPSTSPEVIGYQIFWGTGAGNYQNVRDVQNVLATSLTLSRSSQYYVTVSAYTMATSSPLSNEVIVPVTW